MLMEEEWELFVTAREVHAPPRGETPKAVEVESRENKHGTHAPTRAESSLERVCQRGGVEADGVNDDRR